MKARNKFLIGGAVVVVTSGFLMWTATEQTGTYFFTPAQLHAAVASSPEKLKKDVRVGAFAVPGTIVREPGGRDLRFRAGFEGDTVDVAFHGEIPDTFTEGVNIVVEGHLDDKGTFLATTLLAKCASRYENGPPGGSPAMPKKAVGVASR